MTPSTGLALVDTFVLSADNWADDNLPLLYEFSIMQYSSKVNPKPSTLNPNLQTLNPKP